jgi:hypothetical protein
MTGVVLFGTLVVGVALGFLPLPPKAATDDAATAATSATAATIVQMRRRLIWRARAWARRAWVARAPAPWRGGLRLATGLGWT